MNILPFLRILLTLFAVAILFIPGKYSFHSYASEIENLKQIEAPARQAATALDAILDTCEVERYTFLEDRAYTPYTRHSPKNFYVYSGVEGVVQYHPLIFDRQMKSFFASQIIVVKGDDYDYEYRSFEKPVFLEIVDFLEDDFSTTPWPCASNLLSPPGYTVFYRNIEKSAE